MNDLTMQEMTLPEVKYWNGQRVVTFKDVDEVHGRPDGTAKRNFNSNKKHFIKDIDYFETTREELRTNFAPNSKPLKGNPKLKAYLLTETGYLMIVKSFTDDLSWTVQRELVNSYFRAKEEQKEEFFIEKDENRFKTSNTILPKNPNWYKRNRRRMNFIAEETHISLSTLYHHILVRLGEEYDIDNANHVYEEETGHPPKYAMDIVSYFPQLAELATEYLDSVEAKVIEHINR
jgi:phage regulator Rha-like protein